MWQINQYPHALQALISETQKSGFNMASEPKTGTLLMALAASKPKGRLLELGTGTGISTAWLLQGMDQHASLLSIDNDPHCQQIAQKHCANDPRVTFVCQDGDEFLAVAQDQKFDLIFADAWPGKFSSLELALNLVAEGGLYIIDDLLPQDNWPEGHAPRIPKLIQTLESNPAFRSLKMEWASGLMVLVRHLG